MKQILLLIGILPIIVFGQIEKKGEKLRLSINVFDPIQIPGNDKYFNDNWLVDYSCGTQDLPHERKYSRIGLGIEVGYLLKNENSIILNFGIGNRKISESIYYFTPNPMNHPDEVMKGGTEILYKQNNYNFSVFYQSRIKIKSFEFYGAFGISYLLQGIGKQENIIWNTENAYANMPADSIYSKTNSEFAMGQNLGIGLRIGFNINLYKKLKIGADFTNYLYYSFYNPKSSHTSTSFQRRLAYDNTGSFILRSVETTSSSKVEYYSNFTQFSFTKISPCLKVTFDF
jgi:hypothetical protein